jgi:hypothetical protein
MPCEKRESKTSLECSAPDQPWLAQAQEGSFRGRYLVPRLKIDPP